MVLDGLSGLLVPSSFAARQEGIIPNAQLKPRLVSYNVKLTNVKFTAEKTQEPIDTCLFVSRQPQKIHSDVYENDTPKNGEGVQ